MKVYKNFFPDLGLLYTSAIWGTTFFLVKGILQYIDPVILCGYRFLLAALILAIFLVYTRKSLFENLKEGLVLGFFLWLIYISQTVGLLYTTASNAAFITGLFIIFIPVFLFIFFRVVPSYKSLFAVSIAFLGLWVLTGGLHEINRGDLITLLTAFAYALHVIFADRFVKKQINPYTLCFQQFLFVALFSFISGIIFKLPFSIGNVTVIQIILFLTIFPTVSAFVIQLVAQKITSPVKVSLIFALEPLFGAIFAWTLGGESYTSNQIVGGGLIFLAIVVHEIRLGLKSSYKPVTDNLYP